MHFALCYWQNTKPRLAQKINNRKRSRKISLKVIAVTRYSSSKQNHLTRVASPCHLATCMTVTVHGKVKRVTFVYSIMDDVYDEDNLSVIKIENCFY